MFRTSTSTGSAERNCKGAAYDYFKWGRETNLGKYDRSHLVLESVYVCKLNGLIGGF